MSERRAPHHSRASELIAKRREAYERRGRVYKIVFVLLGIVITLSGVAMLLLPGPAFVVIPIGLAMLAVRFPWAERALVKALEQADRAQQKAREATTFQKALGAAGTAACIGGAAAAAILWDIPVLPV